MVRLLQSGLIEPKDLARKYASELHATEIMLLAYYVAAVNIETTYNALQAEAAQRDGEPEPDYVPFDGIALADTFQVYEDDDTLDLDVFEDNNERIERQKAAPIHVIIGNPPYSAGQKSANDNNANLKYPTLDKRIEETYVARSTAKLKISLHDSYLRAFRWATDRIRHFGVIAFVSNGGWIDGNAGNGVRLTMQKEFSDIYVFNLRGNQRTSGEQSRKEGGKVFGSGSRATIAILIGIKQPNKIGCSIHYRDIGDYLTTEQKLSIVDRSTVNTIEWTGITPNAHGDWINQRSDEFSTWPILGDKKNNSAQRFFKTYSAGLKTSRDAWAYNASADKVRESILDTIDYYNSRVDELLDTVNPNEQISTYLMQDPTRFTWDAVNKKQVTQGIRIEYREDNIVLGLYRPFFKQHGYFDQHRQLNNSVYLLPSMYPTQEHDNIGFVLTGAASHYDFGLIGTNLLPNLHTLDTGQFFPRWTWEPVGAPEGQLDFGTAASSTSEKGVEGEVLDGYRRVDNITDEILGIYREALGSNITKDEIFYFVYGKLHDPVYRETYAADLKKMLPHIETPATREEFDKFAETGWKLMDLHVNYEDVEPFPLDIQVRGDQNDRETWRVLKLKWAKKKDPETGKSVNDVTKMIYNKQVTIAGIPAEADEYMLGSRSALAWIIDRYQVKKDKASGIVNDPNDWADEVGNPRYIVDLIGKVTRVAVETVEIVKGLNQ